MPQAPLSENRSTPPAGGSAERVRSHPDHEAAAFGDGSQGPEARFVALRASGLPLGRIASELGLDLSLAREWDRQLSAQKAAFRAEAPEADAREGPGVHDCKTSPHQAAPDDKGSRLLQVLAAAAVLVAAVAACLWAVRQFTPRERPRGRLTPLSAEDRNLRFGDHYFGIAYGADPRDPGNPDLLLEDAWCVGDGDSIFDLGSKPGAVHVIVMPQGVTIRDRQFAYREIVLVNSKREYILAPPGTWLSVPFSPGIFRVPSDSKMPLKETQELPRLPRREGARP